MMTELRLHMRPRPVAADIVNDVLCHAKSSSQLATRHARPKLSLNVGNLPLLQNCLGVSLPLDALTAENFECVRDILPARHYFQVIDAVVRFDAINVVDSVSGWYGADESFGNNPMHLLAGVLPINAKTYADVPILVGMDSANMSGSSGASFASAHDAPKVRDGVIGLKADNGLPNFGGHSL